MRYSSAVILPALVSVTLICAAPCSASAQQQQQQERDSVLRMEQADSTPKLTRKRAELLVPRLALHPVKSMIPGQSSPLDTIDTSNPRIKLVLYDDNTWKYVKDGDLVKNDSTFTTSWDSGRANPYHTTFAELPDRVSIWLVDSSSQFCVPYQTKIYSRFGVRRGRRHQGVDLPLKTGEQVRAAFDGKVRISSYMKGYGNLVVIRHENGLETFYGHLSKRLVEENQWVHAGDVVGLGGSTGRSTGPHLHFETRYQGYAFDPSWIADFEKGTLRSGVFTLKKKYLSARSNYVPESEDEEEDILIAEKEDREEEARIAAEEAAKRYHTIRSGDTLGALAVKYGTTVRQLCAWNGIKATTTLRIGRKLRVK